MKKQVVAGLLLALFVGGFAAGRAIPFGKEEREERKPQWALIEGESPLEVDKRLEKPVTVEVRRLPLRLFLSRISKACGVRVDISGSLFREFPEVAAMVRGRPAREVLEALAHIYWARWERAREGYILLPLEELGWEGVLARLQSGARAFSRNEAIRRGMAIYSIHRLDEISRWAAKFVPPQWGEALTTTGAPVSCLPLHVRQRLYQAHIATRYMCQLRDVMGADPLEAYSRAA